MLILPLGTQRESQKRLPFLTILVCLTCIVVHLMVTREATKLAYAFDPRTMQVGHMITAAFLHGSWSHLIGNLFFFFCFASTIEREITAKGYIALFLLFAIVTHVSFALLTKVYLPSLGLSGVVWGFMGLFLARFPFEKVDCFVWFLWKMRIVGVPALLFVLGYLFMDVGALRRNEPGVNHVAHLSGFMAGMILIGLWSLLERPTAPRKVRRQPVPARTTTIAPPTVQDHDWR